MNDNCTTFLSQNAVKFFLKATQHDAFLIYSLTGLLICFSKFCFVNLLNFIISSCWS